MAYEPAINTTESGGEKVKRQLDLTLALASDHGLAVIGFLITTDGVAEPFASGELSMRPEEFRHFIEILASAMIDASAEP